MNILVTGGGGFLGFEICKQLKELNYHVTSLSRYHHTSLDEIHVKTLKADLANLKDIDLSSFDVIVHTAAIAGVWGRKSDFYKVNYEGSVKLFNLAREQSVKYFIYTSTPSVVFSNDDIILGDETLPYPNKFYTHYAKTKALAEKYILSQSDDKIRSIAIRPHLIWGKGDPHIFPRIFQKARAGKLKIVGSGDNMVDIIHVKNAAFAHVLALRALLEGKEISGRAYFIGQEKPVNLWDFINKVLVHNGMEPINDFIDYKFAYYIGLFMEALYRFLGINKPEPPMTRFIAMQLAKNHYFSHANACKDFGYTPMITIDEGIEESFSSLEHEVKIRNIIKS